MRCQAWVLPNHQNNDRLGLCGSEGSSSNPPTGSVITHTSWKIFQSGETQSAIEQGGGRLNLGLLFLIFKVIQFNIKLNCSDKEKQFEDLGNSCRLVVPPPPAPPRVSLIS